MIILENVGRFGPVVALLRQRTDPSRAIENPIVAQMSTRDSLTRMQASAVLYQAGIEFKVEETGLIASIEVNASHEEETQTLLFQDSEQRRHPIFIVDLAAGGNGLREIRWKAGDSGTLTRVGKRYEELLNDPSYAQNSLLGGVIRLEWVRNAVRDFPFVNFLTIIRRTYLARPGTGGQLEQVGYDVNLYLGRSAKDSSMGAPEVSFQVWNEGKTFRHVLSGH